MSTTIVGLVDEPQSAYFLQKEIKKRGLRDRDIELLSWKRLIAGEAPRGFNPPSRDTEALKKSLGEHLRDWGVSEQDSRDFVQAVLRGANIVMARSDNPAKINRIEDLMAQIEVVDLDERRDSWRKRR